MSSDQDEWTRDEGTEHTLEYYWHKEDEADLLYLLQPFKGLATKIVSC